MWKPGTLDWGFEVSLQLYLEACNIPLFPLNLTLYNQPPLNPPPATDTTSGIGAARDLAWGNTQAPPNKQGMYIRIGKARDKGSRIGGTEQRGSTAPYYQTLKRTLYNGSCLTCKIEGDGLFQHQVTTYAVPQGVRPQPTARGPHPRDHLVRVLLSFQLTYIRT